MLTLIPIRLLLRRRFRHDQGSAMIEFALIGFMFVMVLLAIIEMGRMIIVYTAVANSAKAGTRYAIVHGQYRTGTGATGPSGPGNTTQVENVVKGYASTGLLNTSKLTITVTYDSGDNNVGDTVSVKVTYPYNALVPFFSSLLGPTMGSTSQGTIMF